MYEHRTERRVEFADTDLAGIVHFARFFVFMESAEHEFLTRLGTPVHFQHEGRQVGWPRLAASCRYVSPAHFGDVLEIRVRVKRKGTKSMTYAVDFRLGSRLVAEGEISSICCALIDEDGVRRLESIPIPAHLAEQITEASSRTQGAPT